MAERAKPRGAGSRSRQDKPRPSKKGSPRSSGRASLQPSPSPDAEPPEPLDVGPILDELLERALTESERAALTRQLVPFAVSRVRDAIVFVAEWRFLARDDGDPEPEGDEDPERDGAWKEDEEPPAGVLDTLTSNLVAVEEAFLPLEELSSEELLAADEAEGQPVSPGDVPAAAPALGVPVSPGQLPSGDVPVTAEGPARDQPRPAAAAAPPARRPRPRPPRPQPPGAPQPPERGRRLSRAPGRDRQPSRPPRRRAARPDAPRPPAPPPAAPSVPAAPAAPEPREGAVKVGDQEPAPPSSSSRSSPASIQPRRPSPSPGVPRLGARRGVTRWVLPEVKVVDVSTDAERPRSGASRSRFTLPGSLVQIIPGAGRATRGEPQLCDPWLASARLAPGVTVRWGGSERRGPALARRGGDEQGDEALRRAEKDLKPILPFPECHLSEYKESEEELENLLGKWQLPGLPLPRAVPSPVGSLSPPVSPIQGLASGVAPWDAPGARGSIAQK